jgi:hypothetical protein
MEIIAKSLPPQVAGLGAGIAAKDMSDRHKQSKSALYCDLLLEGTFFALADIIDEAKRQKTVLLETIDFYNESLRQSPLLMLERITQRQQIVHTAQKRHPTLDPATLDWVLREVAAAVRRNPKLAGMPVEVPADYMGEPNGPKWESEGALILCRDLASSPPDNVPLLEWANRCARDLIGSIYKHARRNLLDWGYRQPRVNLPHSEVAPSVLQASDPATLSANIDLLQKALDVVASPDERDILRMLIEGLSPAEIAQVLNADRWAIYKRIERMRRKLAPMLR